MVVILFWVRHSDVPVNSWQIFCNLKKIKYKTTCQPHSFTLFQKGGQKYIVSLKKKQPRQKKNR
ncbi:MAG: hypothetical protein DYG98_20745 [Haliscomenobacteraceae bacterium CHB4]|nr:hypothetical protein [Haliscomenobacteraceae bacterium CHB4]